MAWDPDGSSLVSGGGLGQVRTLRADRGRTVGSAIPTATGEIRTIALGGGGQLAAVAGNNGDTAVVDLASHQRLYSFRGPPSHVQDVLFLAADDALVSVASDGFASLRHLDASWWERRACVKAGRTMTEDEVDSFLQPGYPTACD